MRANHDYFLGPIRSGNFADDVERIQVFVMEPVIDVQLQSDWNALLDVPKHQSVMFGRKDDLGGNGSCVCGEIAAALHYRIAAGSVAMVDHSQYAFFQKKIWAGVKREILLTGSALSTLTTASLRPEVG